MTFWSSFNGYKTHAQGCVGHAPEVLFEIYFSKVLSPKRAKVVFRDFQSNRLKNR